MLTELRNARIIDPSQPDASLTSLLYENAHIVAPDAERNADRVIDLGGAFVLAGGIDIHTHIGGGKVNIARMLMSEVRGKDGGPVWPTLRTGQLYSEMGYTACFEPAMLLSGSRHTHLELADTPYIDSGAYVVLGNEDWLLSLLADGAEHQIICEHVSWAVKATRALAVKVVNAGGIDAFKFNKRTLDVDEAHPKYGVTPRQVLAALSAATEDIGLAHPLHVHASNLGMPGNINATIETLKAADGRRMHLTHAQFNCYSSDGPRSMASGAAQLADFVNRNANVSLDVGQVVFGQTVTISADAAAQFRNRGHAHPDRWIISDIECQAGCGVVPIKYEDQRYVHSLQWTIGLELMLLIEDPYRVFLTTDHPNGGPFTSYPHLIRLLMDRTFRNEMLDRVHSTVRENTLLNDLDREYSLDEIAIITRVAPAEILGLSERGHLRPGAVADLAVYREQSNWEETFKSANWVFKSGVPIVESGDSLNATVPCKTVSAEPDFTSALSPATMSRIEQSLHVPVSTLAISETELHDLIRRETAVSCMGGSKS